MTARNEAAYWGCRFIAFTLAVWAASLVFGFMWALMVLTLTSMAIAMVGLRRPVMGLLGIGALCTLAPVATALLFTGGIWRWHTVNYWLLLVQLIFLPFLLRLNDPHTRLLKVFIGVLALQLLITPDFDSGIEQLLLMLTPLALLIYFGRAAHDTEVWYWLAVTAGILAAVGDTVYYLQIAHLPPLNENVSAYLPLTAIFATCLGFRSVVGSPSRRRILSALTMANVIWVSVSGSRGATFSGIACLVFLITQMPGAKVRLVFSVSLVVVAFGVAEGFPGLRDHALVKFQVLLDPSLSADRRTNARSDLVAGGLRMFREHPLGVGTGGFPYYWARLNSLEGQREFYRIGEMAPPHAGWIRVLSENGVVGAGVLASFIFSFAIVGWQHRRPGAAALGIFVAVTLAVAFISSDVTQMGLWFLAAGAIMQLHHERAVQLCHAFKKQPWRVNVARRTDARFRRAVLRIRHENTPMQTPSCQR